MCSVLSPATSPPPQPPSFSGDVPLGATDTLTLRIHSTTAEMAHSAPPQNLKRQVFACITKLADRDTYSLAVSELESIAANLDQSSLPTFLSCIHATDSADKPLVRKQCIRLLAVLAENYGSSLAPYLPKMLSTITKRLRDQDSTIRSTCVAATGALSLHIAKPSFSSFLKPLSDALFTEQELNSQIGAALCLASAVEASPDPEPARLAKILPRLEKLLKCESFKAKAALITLIGSTVEVGAASTAGVLKNLVPCVLQFLSSEDWAARKAAAEVLLKLAVVERDMLPEFKTGSMKVLENRRCDKVKAVREVMNQTVEAWKQIPDVSDEFSPPPKSQTSSREDASDGRYLSGSKNSCISSCGPSQMRKACIPSSRSTPPERSSATTVRKRNPLMSSDTKTSPAIFRKLERKKTSDWKVEVAVTHSPSLSAVCEDDLKRGGSTSDVRLNENSRFSKSETKRSLFNKNSDEKTHKFGGCKSGSRVVPYLEENSENTGLVSNVSGDSHRNHKESEELSLIRKQLFQIEQQQSSLLDLLQKFIGSSQSGMQSLETRVHGLEMALDGISYDLAVSSAKMSKADSSGTTCCRLLPGADFLSSKFWRRTEGRCSTSSFLPSGGTPSMAAMHYRAGNNSTASNMKFQNPRFQLQGGGGLIVNPLAEVPTSSMVNSGPAHY